MADSTMLGLPVATAIDGSEYAWISQTGTDKRVATGLFIQGSASASTQSANTVFAGPSTGSAAAPTFRALVAADFSAATWAVTQGGTGLTSATAYAVLCGGTTSTGAFQSVASVGTTGQALLSNGAGMLPTFQTLSTAVGAALTRVDDTNVTLTLGGTPTTALLAATSLTLGWTGQLSLARGGTAANLTASTGGIVYSGASALAILSGTATANQVLVSGSSAAPAWSTSTYPATSAAGTILASLTTNTITATATPTLGIAGSVLGTLALTGNTSGTVTITPQAAAGTPTLTLPDTSGTLAASATSPITLNTTTGAIGITGAALTRVDDTNVTLTLGGTPSSALVTAASLTLGWTGQLALTRGGTNASLTASNGGIVYSDASAMAILSGTATAGQIVRSGSSAAPSWSTSVYPATSSAGTILASLTANTITASAAPVIGAAGSATGQVGLSGTTSGTVTIKVSDAAGTYNFNLPETVGTAGQFLTSQGGGATAMTWSSAAGTGDVVGPASATDNAIARYDGTTGKLIQDSVVTIADTTGVIAGGKFANAAGIPVLDSDSSHVLGITTSSNLTADRLLTLVPGDAARTVTISGDATISQDYSTTGNPQFATIELGAASDTTISRSAAGVIAVEGVPLYSNIPQNSQSDNYTLVLGDAQKHIYETGASKTITIPANASVAFPIGTAVTFVSASNAVTIAITSDTMTLAGAGTTGSRTLAANSIATAMKIASTSWIISGVGLT